MLASELMTSDVIQGSLEWNVGKALETMDHHGIRHLPIVESGVLHGIVSERDVRRHLLPMRMEEDNPKTAEWLLELPIANVMVQDVSTVGPEDSVAEVIDKMLDEKVGAFPVVDPTDGELKGMISYVDILGALRDTLD